MAIHNNICDKCNKKNLVSIPKDIDETSTQNTIDVAARMNQIVRMYTNNGNPNMRRDYHTLCTPCWGTVQKWMVYGKTSSFPRNTPFNVLNQKCGRCGATKHAYFMHTIANLYNYEKDQYVLCSKCMKGFLLLFGDNEQTVEEYPAYAELPYVKHQFMTLFPDQYQVLYGGQHV